MHCYQMSQSLKLDLTRRNGRSIYCTRIIIFVDGFLSNLIYWMSCIYFILIYGGEVKGINAVIIMVNKLSLRHFMNRTEA